MGFRGSRVQIPPSRFNKQRPRIVLLCVAVSYARSSCYVCATIWPRLPRLSDQPHLNARYSRRSCSGAKKTPKAETKARCQALCDGCAFSGRRTLGISSSGRKRPRAACVVASSHLDRRWRESHTRTIRCTIGQRSRCNHRGTVGRRQGCVWAKAPTTVDEVFNRITHIRRCSPYARGQHPTWF